jgi:hypothetical protein
MKRNKRIFRFPTNLFISSDDEAKTTSKVFLPYVNTNHNHLKVFNLHCLKI